MINALQFTDMAVGGFEAAVQGFVSRRQEQAACQAQEEEAGAWATAQAWRQHAQAVERSNAQLRRQLELLERDYLKLQSKSQSVQDTLSRYSAMLIARIQELNEKYQQASAQHFASERARIRERKPTAPGESRGAAYAERSSAFNADLQRFMQTQNVRLGVPDVFDLLRK